MFIILKGMHPKEGHEHLLFQVRQLQQDLHRSNVPIAWRALEFLREWLLDHIVHSDKMMGEYLNVRRVF